ncbi:MAG: hypothetical protein EOO05_21150 [Chitinophagaceae bacterium]|nr:MAG: hypothetical protein EOO05_21150 [Chitinophagaceae bacterium]
MKMKLFVFVIGCMVAVSDAAACSCRPLGTVAEEFQKSDYVIKGRVLSVDTVTITDAIRLKRGLRFWKPKFEYSTHQMLMAKLVVEKGYKSVRQLDDTVYVFTGMQTAACGYPFSPAGNTGEGRASGEYLVYGMKTDKTAASYSVGDSGKKKIKASSHLVTGLCMATKQSNKEEEGQLAAMGQTAGK